MKNNVCYSLHKSHLSLHKLVIIAPLVRIISLANNNSELITEIAFGKPASLLYRTAYTKQKSKAKVLTTLPFLL
jgi:hypothetical protein